MANTHPVFELVSFDICPYVQRSVVTLLHKKVPFKITYIDLASPPEWFKELSPLGRVPLLLVRDSSIGKQEPIQPTVLFESAVINEYIDEVTPPSVMPGTPLERAQHRAWIAASGELLGNLYTYMTSKDVLEVEEAKNELWDILGKLEETVTGEGFFAARGFSLVDSAFAPVFLRLLHMKSLRDDPTWKNLPKTKRLAQALIELPEVRDSVIPEFYERYRTYLKKHGALMASDWT